MPPPHTQVINVAGAESPLFQALQGIILGLEEGRRLQDRKRRMQQEELAAQQAEEERQLKLAGIQRAAAAETPLADAPQVPFNERPAEVGVPPLLAKPPEEPQEWQAPDPTVVPPDAGATTPRNFPERDVFITIKGKKVPLRPAGIKPPPLQYKEEAEADSLRKIELEKDARADVMDVPDDPGFGTLAGKQKVRTSTVNAYLAALARKDAAETNRLIRQYSLDLKAASDADKRNEDAENGRVDAQAWAAGQAFPSSQKSRSGALRYMDAHPEEFPRRPRDLSTAQQDEVLRATYALNTIDAVDKAYQKVKNKIGPVKYQLSELKLKVPGIDADPDFVTFNTLMRGMNNLEIKRITGAQMSEAEASRLLTAMATGSLRPADFEAALSVMKRNASAQREVQLYGSVSKETAAQSAAPAAAPAAAATTGKAVKPPANKAEYDALPSGSNWIDAKGKPWKKP